MKITFKPKKNITYDTAANTVRIFEWMPYLAFGSNIDDSGHAIPVPKITN